MSNKSNISKVKRETRYLINPTVKINIGITILTSNGVHKKMSPTIHSIKPIAFVNSTPMYRNISWKNPLLGLLTT